MPRFISNYHKIHMQTPEVRSGTLNMLPAHGKFYQPLIKHIMQIKKNYVTSTLVLILR